MRIARSIALAGAITAAAATPTIAADLEAAIEHDPYDDGTFAVYGDWLQEHGLPHGELVALQAATARDPTLEDALRAHIDRHPSLLPRCRSGTLWWCNGFVRRAEDIAPAHVEELLAHPSSRFLAELAIRVDVELDRRAVSPEVEPVFRLLGERRHAALRTLEVRGERAQFGWLGDVAAICDGVPNLERLALRGGMRFTRLLELPALRELSVGSFRIQPDTIAALAAARWPELTSLEIQPGACTYEALGALASWLASRALPRLDTLAICNTYHPQRVLGPLVRSGRLPEVRTLALTNVQLTDQHATYLARYDHALRGVERLDVSRNQLTRLGIDRLREVVPHVIADDQGKARGPWDGTPAL